MRMDTEEVTIVFKDRKVTEEFFPVFAIDPLHPFELISLSRKICLLYIYAADDEAGEYWYVIEGDSVKEYAQGKISVREMMQTEGTKTWIGYRTYENYELIEVQGTLEEKLREGFLKEEELPSKRAYVDGVREVES